MKATATVPTSAGWVRVRLAGPSSAEHPGRPSLTEGELVLRADRVHVEAEHLVFLVGPEEVFRLERRYFRSMAWVVDRPTFGEWLRERRAKYPNQRRPWSQEECQRLAEEIGARGMDWAQIAEAHGRTVSAVKQQARHINDDRSGV